VFIFSAGGLLVPEGIIEQGLTENIQCNKKKMYKVFCGNLLPMKLIIIA
jgi:hypothetical protein